MIDQVRYIEDGVLIAKQGQIRWFGSWDDAQTHLPANVEIQHYPEQLIIPGMIDTHIHFLQNEMVGGIWRTVIKLAQYLHFSHRNPVSRPVMPKIAEFLFRNYLKWHNHSLSILYSSS